MAGIPHDYVPQDEADLARCLADPEWRLFSGRLYKIMVKTSREDEGTAIPFKPNRAQRRFLSRLWHRNVILKARQLGFTTLICILFLDHAMFNSDQRCGIVAQDRESAESFFRDKVVFAYRNLPAEIQAARPLARERAAELEFSNNSSIRVGTSLRSGTYHRLLVSELGKTSAKFPEKAREIITGSLPTCPLDGIAIIESTAEGDEGQFATICKKAMEVAETGRPLTQRDYRFHFFPWWQEPGYCLSDAEAKLVVITPKEHEYFDGVETVMNTRLSLGQRAWYIATRESDQAGDPDDMRREYPGTPLEAFQRSIEGYYYAVQLANARRGGRIGAVPYLPGYAVNTFWDIGNSDGTAIWLHQRVGLQDRFFAFVEGWEKPYSYYGAELQKISDMNDGIVWGTHHLPHDAGHKRQGLTLIKAPVDDLRKLAIGGTWKVLDRVHDLQHGIQLTRKAIQASYFDEAGTKPGVLHLAGYKKKWDRVRSEWTDEPVKNIHTEGADSFRQFAQAFKAPAERDEDDRRGRHKPKHWKVG